MPSPADPLTPATATGRSPSLPAPRGPFRANRGRRRPDRPPRRRSPGRSGASSLARKKRAEHDCQISSNDWARGCPCRSIAFSGLFSRTGSCSLRSVQFEPQKDHEINGLRLGPGGTSAGRETPPIRPARSRTGPDGDVARVVILSLLTRRQFLGPRRGWAGPHSPFRGARHRCAEPEPGATEPRHPFAGWAHRWHEPAHQCAGPGQW